MYGNIKYKVMFGGGIRFQCNLGTHHSAIIIIDIHFLFDLRAQKATLYSLLYKFNIYSAAGKCLCVLWSSAVLSKLIIFTPL